MLDELRQQIQTYLDELLGQADKLRHALAALGSRDGAAPPPSTSAAPSAAPERARRAPAPRTATRKPTRSRASASTATTAASAEPVEPPASAPAAGPARTAARAASGSTKIAVLQALAGGSAMTAGEVATATGLGRASVSTTLSKLANSGEVTKAARGYQLAGQTPGAPADAASAESEQPAGKQRV
jgi:DNA-binding transcriptional ArsR family regulator